MCECVLVMAADAHLHSRGESSEALFGPYCAVMGVTDISVLPRQRAALVLNPLSQLTRVTLKYPQL